MNRAQELLTHIIPEERVKARLIDRVAYAHDASYFRLVPQAVVQPNSISEIQAIFNLSQEGFYSLRLFFRGDLIQMEGDVGVVEKPQTGQDRPDLFILNQRRLSDGLIGHARALKGLDQGLALRAQPVKHGKIGKGIAQ